MSDYVMIKPNELYHFGIEGMKWGIRRYQNPDGSLTEAGRKRLGRAKQEFNKLEPSRKKYLANKPTIDTASALALDRYKTKQGELIANTVATGAVAGGAAFVGGKLFGPYGAAIAGGLPVLKNLPKGIQLAIETAYNKIAYEDADKLRKAYEKSEKHKSVIDELEGKDSKNTLMEDGKPLSKDEYETKRNSFKTDEEKDSWERKVSEQNSVIKHPSTPKNYSSPNNGKYDMNFLEAIQNSKIEADNNTKAIDDEYEIYKKDPEEYFTKRSRRLEMA